MDEVQWISLAGDVRGETALVHIPQRPSSVTEVMILADNVSHVDAWTGTALRAVIEYHARIRQRRVVLSPPKTATVARLLAGLLDTDLPAHFCLSNDAAAVGSRPRNVIVPSVVVNTFADADNLGDAVPDLGSAYPSRPIRFLAGAATVLAENAVEHASDSPIGGVVTLLHEREEDELQLVVSDLGRKISSSPDASKALAEVSRKSADGEASLAWLTLMTEQLGLDATLTLASGSARVYWRAGRWTEAQAQHVEGFTAALALHL